MARERLYREWALEERLPSEISPERARDIMVDCFATVHGPHYAHTKRLLGVSAEEADVRRSIKGILRIAFRQAKGDFEKPDRDSLYEVAEYLREKSVTWGTPAHVTATHFSEMERVLLRVRSNQN
ncbi:MAG: hypothetical protein JXE06_08685 [Coriobacteriia bacterium]|nr:hypothetical protein [Coriobacteriia bacterium]MBN2823133.1 hypothetical protein [Coriobacteriia bacterium]